MEREWGPVFVHESGHALMAVLCEIECHGIYFERDAEKPRFCALTTPTAPANRTNKDYLVSAAGVAAEKLIYHNESEGADADRLDFAQASAPSFDATVDEAYEILSANKRKLKRLVSMLKSKAREVDLDLGRLPELGMDGTQKRYLVLLGKEELESAVRRP
jgi:hypothetical protein